MTGILTVRCSAMMILRPLLVLGLILSLATVAADAAAPKKGPSKKGGKKGEGHVHHGVVVKLGDNSFAIKHHHGKKSKATAVAKAGAKKGKKGKGAGHEFHFTKNTPGADKLAVGKHVLVKSEGREAKEIKVLDGEKKKKKKKK